MASANGTSPGGNNIKVVARFRPQNKLELTNGGEPIVKFSGVDTCEINSAETPFTFDRVFDMSSRQNDIFDFSIRSTVEDVMNGYNGTVFAYGQTGAGKSYTMMGDMDDEITKGIIPRITEQIFNAILIHGSQQIEYTVGISYLEIYMERIRDLLNPAMDNLPINEGPKGPYVKGLREIYVNEVEQVYTAMHLGQRSRVTASTNMNLESSRSHSIFLVTINQKDVNTGSQKSGMLYLVDLAGSEKVGKTGASGQTLEEAKKINKSLSSLGMVINALTDGKSTHIPYRDSKLTRILQESLGGNSRTTLIINCSPSSYNDQETASTLRFGMRAKTIKNKAKINAELSPAELKRQLKAAQNQAITFEKYISQLDVELQQWRSGTSVPKEQWTPSLASSTGRIDARPRPGTPSQQPIGLLTSETPSRPDSRTGDRSSTPSMLVEKDEREEFMRRENELQDQLTEKETQFANAERSLEEVREELRMLREGSLRTQKENESLADKLSKTQMEIGKLSQQGQDDMINMDVLKSANSELETELMSVKQQLLDLKMSAKETSAVLDEKHRKKQERMAKMLAGFDLSGDVFSENERKMQSLVDDIEQMHVASANGDAISPEELESVKSRLLETQGFVRQAELHMNDRSELTEFQDSKRMELEGRLADLERAHESVLTSNLSAADIEDVKAKLAHLYSTSRETQLSQITDLRDELTRRNGEITQLRQVVQSHSLAKPNGVAPPTISSRTLAQQITDFDLMKKSLMRDLQNRCERVVELEISLDETREQYNNVLRSSNNRTQQKKMAFLERNLEQLTVVQRQLVEQNTGLKKEVAIAERKLGARNDRIQVLEGLLGESQAKLGEVNAKFEAQLQAVKKRLEDAKVSSRNLSTGGGFGVFGGTVVAPIQGGGGFSFASAGARIAKPLRGGGGGATTVDGVGVTNGAPSFPILSSLQGGGGEGGGSPGSKRNSWFSIARS